MASSARNAITYVCAVSFVRVRARWAGLRNARAFWAIVARWADVLSGNVTCQVAVVSGTAVARGEGETCYLAIHAWVAINRVDRLKGAIVASRTDPAASHRKIRADAIEKRGACVVRK